MEKGKEILTISWVPIPFQIPGYVLPGLWHGIMEFLSQPDQYISSWVVLDTSSFLLLPYLKNEIMFTFLTLTIRNDCFLFPFLFSLSFHFLLLLFFLSQNISLKPTAYGTVISAGDAKNSFAQEIIGVGETEKWRRNASIVWSMFWEEERTLPQAIGSLLTVGKRKISFCRISTDL